MSPERYGAGVGSRHDIARLFAVALTLSALALSAASLHAQAAPPTPQLLQSRRYTGENTRTPIGTSVVALLGRDSGVYVLDQENSVIHVARGATQVRLLGRVGRGPGEMQRPSRMAFFGDSIAVPDASLARVTLFALQGRAVRTIDVTGARAAGFYGVDPVVFGSAGLIMAGWNVPGSAAAAVSEDVALFVRRHGGNRLDKLVHIARRDIRMNVPVVLRGQPANMPREQPFVTVPVWDFAREGGGVVVVDTTGRTSTGMTIRVRQWRNDGQMARTCSLSRPVVPLSDAIYQTGIESVGPPASARDAVRVDWSAVRRLVVRPAALPPFRSVRLASDGTVWIRTGAGLAGKSEEYLVLAPTGCATPQTVVLPAGVVVEDARGRLFITSGFVNDAPAIDTWRY